MAPIFSAAQYVHRPPLHWSPAEAGEAHVSGVQAEAHAPEVLSEVVPATPGGQNVTSWVPSWTRAADYLGRLVAGGHNSSAPGGGSYPPAHPSPGDSGCGTDASVIIHKKHYRRATYIFLFSW